MKSSNIGGQAVLEGIMMRNGGKYSVAVRRTDGEIAVDVQDYKSVIPWKTPLKIPFIRGIFNFVDSLVLGMKTLTYSASFFEEDEEEVLTEEEAARREKVDRLLMNLTVAAAVVIAVAIFMVLPYFLSSIVERYTSSRMLMTVFEGVIRVAVFLLYIFLISRTKDIKRTFMYHGAEHKTIYCYENGLELTVENVRKQPRHHPRCGTSFLFVVIVVSIFLSIVIFTPLEIENTWLRMLLHLLLLPLIVGVTYEFNRYVGGHDGPVSRFLRAPGMWMQNFTTFEPDDSMIEVGIAALKLVLPEEKGADRW